MSKPSVLVAEDEGALITLLRYNLEREGYRVLEAQDGEIDELYNSLFRELLTYMMEDPRTIGLCTHLLFVAKNIERAGDHCTNIAEVVYHMVRAGHLAATRPKSDTTSETSVPYETHA